MYVSSPLRILNLNCGGLVAKLKLILVNRNNSFCPLGAIALQETILTAHTDINHFQSDYSIVYHLAKINKLGGIAFYIHKSFRLERPVTTELNEASTVFPLNLMKMYLTNRRYARYKHCESELSLRVPL